MLQRRLATWSRVTDHCGMQFRASGATALATAMLLVLCGAPRAAFADDPPSGRTAVITVGHEKPPSGAGSRTVTLNGPFPPPPSAAPRKSSKQAQTAQPAAAASAASPPPAAPPPPPPPPPPQQSTRAVVASPPKHRVVALGG